MTVEEIRRNKGDSTDNFPVGMRVLAVDDDPTCLMLLDGLLRKCQYQVTTTSQSTSALKMLRENRNRFDLIISDVYMPDMDGFKLLELVGLEMDLPVIMLSANSDPKLVMKGITHGACDYLVKPVRLEELRNIWQHVIRRKKFDPKSQNNPTAQEESESGDGPIGNTDQNGKLNRKRKDEEEEEEEVGEDNNGHENEDSGTQKRPRVVWSIELHRKFVAAVNQLGIEKAFPKRILDMMNVEGLTRENVASHLQKYRLYLKRISSVASHQANMVAVLGGKDASYLRMASLDGFSGDFQTFSRLPNNATSSYPPSGIFRTLHSPAGTNLCNLSSSSLIPTTRSQSSCNSVNAPGNFQNASLFQGLDSTRIGEFNSVDDPRLFSAGSTITDTRVTVSSSSNYSESFSAADSSVFMDSSRCNENWNSTIQLPKFSSNMLPLSEPFNQDQFPQYNNSSIPNIHNNPTMNQAQNQRHGIQEPDYTNNSNNGFSNLNHQNNGFYNRRMAVSSVGQYSNISALDPFHRAKVEKSITDFEPRFTQGCISEQTKPLGDLVPRGYDSLDDLMHGMMKREQDGRVLMDGEFAFDAYAFGSCI